MENSNLIENTPQEDEIMVEENEVEKEVVDINDDKDDNTIEGDDGEEDKEEGDDGTTKLQCIHCKTFLAKTPTGTTSHLWNHLKRCLQKKLHLKKQKTLQFQPVKSKFEMNPLSDGRYDHMKQREAVAHWILMGEQPFNAVENDGYTFIMSMNQPQFEKISRATAKKDVINVYNIEKKKMQLTLKDINKISLTTDIWKSKVQKISYMCVTGHFVDSEWQLQKRLLSFIPLPPPHGGVDIYDGLIKCTKDWGIEHKVFTISVDNASNNDVAIRIAKETFSRSRKLPLEGQLFYVRCTAHILNLVVQDGLLAIKKIIEDVKNSVRFINQSESRLNKFSDVVHHLGISVKRLIIDCPTRWNSTYEMLLEAYRVRDAFPIFQQREPSYRCCPSILDWMKVKDVVDILEENHVDEFIKVMIKKMKEKFDKYWGSCNLLMAIGAILDPRFKMRLVDFAFHKIYNEIDARANIMKVRDALYNLYFEYVEVDNAKSQKGTTSERCSATCTSSTSQGKLVPSGLSMFDEYLDTVEVNGPLKSELDIYLDEGVVRSQDGDGAVSSEFDALACL
ncbi:zinc finger BED domain-containing protein RICESLEEPER 2-like [Salvia miltiorrhiza]|uniref:zinc finger BED domain-containing protein RICESLEEPER 2-like n=1 Tax=Salvia miltiorrhiza TaxID=226208 RepID=UPI0025AC96AD|nr:zinc finger BED domain-containing protein RICESLEEPER 2-like [Salvia miltiorrhiza]